ncbi:hypothetical protein [Aeromicrobium sp.]|uniref:hypothetical protein n=1 Tax=Aeromicrobium sp. TaxID=1871063 RepID=UPI0030BC2C54
MSGATLAKWGRKGGDRERLDRPYVRAYLRSPHTAERATDCVTILVDRPLPPVVSVFIAGFVKVRPGSSIAVFLADRLARKLRASAGVIVYYRDTSPHLAAWLAEYLEARTSITQTSTVRVPGRRRDVKR